MTMDDRELETMLRRLPGAPSAQLEARILQAAFSRSQQTMGFGAMLKEAVSDVFGSPQHNASIYRWRIASVAGALVLGWLVGMQAMPLSGGTSYEDLEIMGGI